MGRYKINGPTHYGQTSRFTPSTMCGQSAAHVRYTSDLRQVTCRECLQMKQGGAALFPGGERYMKAE